MIGFKTLVDLLQAGYNVRAAVRNQAGFERVARLKPVATYTAQLRSIIVPDMTIPGAYDEAVKGVKYVIHVASPLVTNTPKGVDYESYMIQPAIRGTIGILESANKIPGIEKVVITASVVSITTLAAASKVEIVDGEQCRAAYGVSTYLLLWPHHLTIHL
jgi:nucleoside-diphosphate-sugar epimerase